MRLPNNYKNAVPYSGESRRLTPGGHQCVIQNATVEQSRNGRDMLVVRFDIAGEGEFDGIYLEQYNRARKYNADAKWPGVYRVIIADENGDCTGFFKGFIKAVEESNSGYDFEKAKADERTLSSKWVGLVFREEEYEGSDGKIRTSVKPAWAVSCDRIVDGVEVPAKKELAKKPSAMYDAVEEDDSDQLPF